MPMKVKSDQIICEKYVYQCPAAATWFWMLKARPGEVIVVTMVSIYNPTTNNITTIYKGLRHNGDIRRINYRGALNTKMVQRWGGNNYLTNGCELGIRIVPGAAGDLVEISIQALRFRDDEYFKAT